MKNVLFVLFVCCFLFVANVFAVPVSIIPSNGCSVTSNLTVSSHTATTLLSANVYRKGIAIKNTGSYTVRISSWSNTSQNVGYSILAGEEFSDNIEAYNGIIYGLTNDNNVTSTVDIIEKTGINY